MDGQERESAPATSLGAVVAAWRSSCRVGAPRPLVQQRGSAAYRADAEREEGPKRDASRGRTWVLRGWKQPVDRGDKKREGRHVGRLDRTIAGTGWAERGCAAGWQRPGEGRLSGEKRRASASPSCESDRRRDAGRGWAARRARARGGVQPGAEAGGDSGSGAARGELAMGGVGGDVPARCGLQGTRSRRASTASRRQVSCPWDAKHGLPVRPAWRM